MHILPEPLLIVLQRGVGHLLDQPLDVAAVLQDNGTLFLHFGNILGSHRSHLQYLQDGFIVVLEKVCCVALRPVVGVDDADNSLEVAQALLVVDVLNKRHIAPIVGANIHQVQGAAVKADEIPAVGGRPELHLLNGVIVLVPGVDEPQGRHGGGVAGLIDHDAVARGHLHESHLGVLIHIKHLEAVPVDAAGLCHLRVFVLLIVIVEDVLQGGQESVILAGVNHWLADEIAHGGVGDILGHVVDDFVIGGGAVLFDHPEDVVVSPIVALQVLVFGAVLVFVDDLLDVRFRQALQRGPFHIQDRQSAHLL